MTINNYREFCEAVKQANNEICHVPVELLSKAGREVQAIYGFLTWGIALCESPEELLEFIKNTAEEYTITTSEATLKFKLIVKKLQHLVQ